MFESSDKKAAFKKEQMERSSFLNLLLLVELKSIAKGLTVLLEKIRMRGPRGQVARVDACVCASSAHLSGSCSFVSLGQILRVHES